MTSDWRHIEMLHSSILTMATMVAAETDTLPDVVDGTFRFLSETERDRLLIKGLTLVPPVARSVHARLPRHVELEELISAGTLGLIDAAGKFDPNRCTHFKTYAKFRIRGAILDFLRDSDWCPRDLRRKGRAVRKAVHVTSGRDYEPTASEVAAELGVMLNAYQQLLGELNNAEVESLDVEDQWGNDALAYLAGSETDDPLFQCLRDEMRARVIKAAENLPEKERLVLTLYYDEDQSMKEVGLILGVGECRVSQLHAAAVRRIRRSLGFAPTMPSLTTRPGRAICAIAT